MGISRKCRANEVSSSSPAVSEWKPGNAGTMRRATDVLTARSPFRIPHASFRNWELLQHVMVVCLISQALIALEQVPLFGRDFPRENCLDLSQEQLQLRDRIFCIGRNGLTALAQDQDFATRDTIQTRN